MKKEKIKPIVFIALNVLLIFVIGLLVRELVLNSKDSADDTVTTDVSNVVAKMFADAKKEEVEVSFEVLEESLRNAGTLITGEYYFTLLEEYTNTATTALGIKSTASMTYSYDGVVTAGINCDDVVITVDSENKLINVKIPDASIQNIEIYQESFKPYKEKNGIFNKTDMEMFNESLVELKKKAKDNALEKGILDKAKDNSKFILDKMLRSSITDTDYRIEFV